MSIEELQTSLAEELQLAVALQEDPPDSPLPDIFLLASRSAVATSILALPPLTASYARVWPSPVAYVAGQAAESRSRRVWCSAPAWQLVPSWGVVRTTCLVSLMLVSLSLDVF